MSRSARRADGGALAGPAVHRSTPSAVRPRIEIAGWLCPGGGEALAPTVSDPHWRTSDGEGRRLNAVLAGQAPEIRRKLLEAHANAVAALVGAAAAARLAGAPAKARALCAAASRLIRELIGP